LVWGIRKYRPYLEDRRFLVRTENKALTWLQSAKNGKAKLTRWALELQQYNFGLEHCPGKENELPDFLSRNPEAQEPNHPLDADDTERLLPPERRADSLRPTACPADIAHDGRTAPLTEGTNINGADEPDIALAGEVRAAQQREPHTQELISLRRKLDHDPPVGDWHYGFKENYNVVNGELRFGSTAKLYVPDVVRQRVIFEHHDIPLVGHPGGEETHRSVSESYYWLTNQRDLMSYVKKLPVVCPVQETPKSTKCPAPTKAAPTSIRNQRLRHHGTLSRNTAG
jgi:hypothetical protein